MSTQLLIPTDFILFSKLSSVDFSKSVKKRRIYDNLLCFERHPLFSKKNHSTKNLRLFHMLFDVIVSQRAAACLLHIVFFFLSLIRRVDEEKVDELGLGGGVEIPTLKVCADTCQNFFPMHSLLYSVFLRFTWHCLLSPISTCLIHCECSFVVDPEDHHR